MLPSKPGQPKPLKDLNYTIARPPSPDPRTGLVRIDTKERMPDYYRWWGAPYYRAYTYHGMKDKAASRIPYSINPVLPINTC